MRPKLNSFLILFISGILFQINSASEKSRKVCNLFPANFMQVPVDFVGANLSKEDYNQIKNDIYRIYSPIFFKLGFTLDIRGFWASPDVNAYAYTGFNEKRKIIEIPGGIARHPDMSKDGFAMAICHEIGHHIAGVPYYSELPYLSAEGQADYFSGGSCFKAYLKNTIKKEELASGLELFLPVWAYCRMQYRDLEDVYICQRTITASMAFSKIFKGEGLLVQRDFKITDKTLESYPSAQCRLDTIVSAALCHRTSADGPFLSLDPSVGACHAENGDVIGVRPMCWYDGDRKVWEQNKSFEIIKAMSAGLESILNP